MALNEILNPLTANETWKQLQVYSVNTSAGIISSGNITIQNGAPTLSIIDNVTGSSGRSTIVLIEKPGIMPSKIQQFNNGTLLLQNFQTGGHISLRPGDSFVDIIGPAYPSGPYVLSLDSSNNVVQGSSRGTFIPQLNFDGLHAGMVQSVQLGIYTKIDNVVYFNIEITIGTLGTSTGNALISGLPFVSTSSITTSVPIINRFTTSTPFAEMGVINGSSNIIVLSNSGGTPLSNSNFIATNYLKFTGFYFSS